uniref:RNA-directed RNA polymerase n=1 Tax=Caladenia ophiovirus TaxID=2983933 RepID=A0A9N6YKB1_9VIRU|nr:TPA_asm: polymerase [Caladenia ophiovirus]
MDALIAKLNLNEFENPRSMRLLEKFRDSFVDLTKSIEEEKQEEAKEVVIEFRNQLVMFEEQKNLPIKEGTPALISKIETPYKDISPENLCFILKEDLYPTKWKTKARIELYLFRKCYFNEELNAFPRIVSTQDASFILMKKLFNFSKVSVEGETLWNFGHKLKDVEENILANMMLKKDVNKNRYDLGEEAYRWYWCLDVMETINKNIMMHSSTYVNNKKLGKNIEFYEGKRINTRYYPIGASITRVDFEEKECSLLIYLSSTIQAFYFSDSGTMYLGRPEMLNYSMYLIDNMLSLNIINNCLSNESERSFLKYYKSLIHLPEEKRIKLGSLYEPSCLLLADLKNDSAVMPILDNLIESLEVDKNKTEELIDICYKASGETCIRFSSLAKVLIIANTKAKEGLTKYTTRTNRDHNVKSGTIERLRNLFKMRVISSYIKFHGRVPQLFNVPEELLSQLELKAAKGNYNNNIVRELSAYSKIILGKFLDKGGEANLQTRIIDKACTKDNYDIENNSEKEIQYYINHNMGEVFKDPIQIDKSMYKNGDRIVGVTRRDDPMLKEMKKYMIVRLAEKEKEQKQAARFYGIASFKLKLWISSIMEMIKRAMKLLPGQMMTMSEDERRDTMYKMATKLNTDDAYSLFLDYSGHNTSQRPENTNFILEEIANMYGYRKGDSEYDEITSLSYLFSNIYVIHEDAWSDYTYYSKGQLGAIEGWFGSLWGIQSQLMLDDMFQQMGITDYIGTTYSDDSCGVFTQRNMDQYKLDEIIQNVQKYGRDMGLLVKLSQTQVTNGRCSMLKEHYYKGFPIEMNIKKMMSISPNGAKILNDQLENAKLIDSGYTASCQRSGKITIQTLMRNFRIIKLLASSLKDIILQLTENIDSRYLSKSHNYDNEMRTSLRLIEKGATKEFRVPAKRSDTIGFYKFNIDNKDVLELVIAIMYGPYTTYGYAMTPMPDALISGYSLSNIKRLMYIQGALSIPNKRIIGSLVALSKNALNYLTNPFPMVGGRRDTINYTKDEISKVLKYKVKNEELLDYINRKNDKEELIFKQTIVNIFKDSFNSRITSKYIEESIFSYIDEILAKIDNAGTMKMLLGAKKLLRIIDKAWKSNYNLTVKKSEQLNISYDEIIAERNSITKRMGDGTIEIKFIEIEEVPLMGKVRHLPYRNLIQPIYKGETKLTQNGRVLNPPSKTHHNFAKFDRELGIEGMFEHKLIFKAYDLVRYTKWIIMEIQRFSSGLVDTNKNILIKTCNYTLSTFSDIKYEDIEEYVVCPKGGRYFHRALTGGFNPKTGDMSSNLITNKYDTSGIDRILAITGGADNNLNIQYLMIYIKVVLGILEPKPYELLPLGITEDVIVHLKDVTFNLSLNDFEFQGMRTFPLAIKQNILKRGQLYYNYSSYICYDDTLKNKFINHNSIQKELDIKMESSFRKLYNYMLDQFILSPTMIADETLKGLLDPEIWKIGKENFYREFYSYYKTLNIINNETPARAIIRGLLYEELFSHDLEGNLWIEEITHLGYSSAYKRALMKLFILSTSLSYKIIENNNAINIQVNYYRTKLNARQNFDKIKTGKFHFYIKDNRITNTIINSFPTLAYKYEQIEDIAEEVCFLVDNREFDQQIISSYFLDTQPGYIDKNTDLTYGIVDYNKLYINPMDLIDQKGINSAIKGFEMSCQLSVSPRNISSPTMSAVYPSARGILQRIIGDEILTRKENVIELCGGRGDFHLAMSEQEINHTTLSREDGYNLANRIPGMTSKKVTFNCFEREEYLKYFDHDFFLLDISHITNKKDCLSSLIGDLKSNKKKILMRLNGMFKFFNEKIVEEILDTECIVFIPELNSPGYIYLYIDFEKGTTKNIDSLQKGYNRSLLSSALTTQIGKCNTKDLFCDIGIKVKDQTQEGISDEKILEFMLDEEKLIRTPEIFKVTNSLDFADNLCAFVDKDLFRKYKEYITVPTKKIVTKGTEGAQNLYELGKDLRTNESLILVNRRLIENSYEIITGITETPEDIFLEILKNINSNKYNRKLTKECWKFILEFPNRPKLISTEVMVESLEISKLEKNKIKALNNIYSIASHAVFSYKTNTIEKGLLKIANLESLKRKTVLKHKDKTTKTNILNYKLIINRIMCLTDYFDENYWCGISYQKQEEAWNNKININLGDEEIIEKMKNYKSLSEFFKNDNTFDFLGGLSDSILEMQENVLLEQKELDPETIIKFLPFEVTEEEILRNREMDTHEKVLEEVGLEEFYEALELEDWGDYE